MKKNTMNTVKKMIAEHQKLARDRSLNVHIRSIHEHGYVSFQRIEKMIQFEYSQYDIVAQIKCEKGYIKECMPSHKNNITVQEIKKGIFLELSSL